MMSSGGGGDFHCSAESDKNLNFFAVGEGGKNLNICLSSCLCLLEEGPHWEWMGCKWIMHPSHSSIQQGP